MEMWDKLGINKRTLRGDRAAVALSPLNPAALISGPTVHYLTINYNLHYFYVFKEEEKYIC